MKIRGFILPALAVLSLGSVGGPVRGDSPVPSKKVLVELYASPECKACASASEMLGKLADLGYGPDRVIPVTFPVDDSPAHRLGPVTDSASANRHRPIFYRKVLNRDDLLSTPLMVVDGRFPVVGTDRSKLLKALDRATKEPAGVSVELTLTGSGPRKSLSVKIQSRAPEVAGRDLMVGVALTEDRTITEAKPGESAGRTLVERNVVRRLEQKSTKLDAKGFRHLTIPVELDSSWNAEQVQLIAFVQDRLSGEVYQAEVLAWKSDRDPAPSARRIHDLHRTIAKRKQRQAQATPGMNLNFAEFATAYAASQQDSSNVSDQSSTQINFCPNCNGPATLADFFALMDELKSLERMKVIIVPAPTS